MKLKSSWTPSSLVQHKLKQPGLESLTPLLLPAVEVDVAAEAASSPEPVTANCPAAPLVVTVPGDPCSRLGARPKAHHPIRSPGLWSVLAVGEGSVPLMHCFNTKSSWRIISWTLMTVWLQSQSESKTKLSASYFHSDGPLPSRGHSKTRCRAKRGGIGIGIFTTKVFIRIITTIVVL